MFPSALISEIAAVNVLNDRKEYTNDQLARVPHPCP